MATASEQLFQAVRAAAPACAGVFVLPLGYEAPPAWALVTRPDGVRVRLDFPDGTDPAQQAAAAAVVSGFDLSDAAVAGRNLAYTRQQALATVMSRGDDTAIAVRAWIKSILFLVNNRLEDLGQTRVLEDEIMAYISANPTIGDPAVPVPVVP